MGNDSKQKVVHCGESGVNNYDGGSMFIHHAIAYSIVINSKI